MEPVLHNSSEFKGMDFPILLEKSDDGFVVSCPLFVGCFSQGDTIEEAKQNIREAIDLCLEEEENGEIAHNYRNRIIEMAAVTL